MKNHLPNNTWNSNFQWFTQLSQSIKILLAICFTLFNTKGFSQVSNYVFSESAGTYNAIAGTSAHGAGWDNAVTTNDIPLGFTFNFNGVDYTTCSINTNGFITFGTTLSANNLFTPISSEVNYAGAISALGFDLVANGSAITYTTTGTAPNRTFIVQWNNAKRNVADGNFNFQIRLNETNNVINIVYGVCSPATTNNHTVQVGLRGATNADFNNRSYGGTSFWDGATVSGTANTATCRTRSGVYPTSGRTFTWSPNYRAQILSADTGSTSWCAGETRNVRVTIKNIGSAPWTDGGGRIFNVGVKWNTNGTSWSDYHVRVSAKNLVPGATETYTLPITASANVNGTYGAPLVGANNLNFDVVNEGVAWFGNLPGNSVFTTPTQTISNPISTVAATPLPANNSSKVCYAGLGSVTSISWGAATGATSYDVYFGAGSLPGSITSNVTSTNYTTGTLLPNTTYYWKIVPRNGCGITTGTPVTWSFTTTGAPCACAPTITTHSTLYINSFQFVGTLNDNASPNISGASGYSDFTNLTPVVRQPQGAVLNIVADAVGASGQPASGFWKAWVDFNNNGVFETTEQVYSLTAFSTESLTFGFVIPASTPVGKYRFRIRVGNVTTFDACTNLSIGETEDYLFEVIADCAAKINTTGLKDVQRCGAGTVTLTATGTGTGVRWYAAATGGTALFDGINFTTPVIPENSRRIYYVAAYNGTCESVFRIPVTAIANPGPTVSFSTVSSFCAATTSGQIITATNGLRLDELINEHFDTGLGVFQQSPTEAGHLNVPNSYWIDRPSPYIPPSPPYEGLAPALSSGYTGGNFVMTNTDLNRSGTLLNRLTLTNNLDTRNFNNLKLEFDLYYFTLITADTELELINYFSVEYSINGGTTWLDLQKITTNKGNPNIWEKVSIDLPSSILNLTTFKIRFSSYSYGRSRSFKESIAAIDNVKISGIKDESSQFGWTSPIAGILYESNCTTPLNATKAATVCVKPTAVQFENNVNFSITASASFSNGCPATGTLVIANDLQVWDTTSSVNWNDAANWKPGSTVPTLDKCVIVKKPVILSSGDGFAKNIIIEPGGTLTINKDRTLTVTDFIKNNTTVDNVKNLVLENDGNLIQMNNGAANTGSMTAKREVKNLRYLPGTFIDYVYWSSPVSGQPLKGPGGFSPGTPNDSFLYYRESNDWFYETGDPTFTPGRGYAVRAEGPTPNTYSKTYEFKGTPNNGNISYPIARSADNPVGVVHGYNLVGNPYPSNIDFNELYLGNLNGNLIYNTAWFWTNNLYTASQMGSNYGGNNYAIFNGTGGVGASSPYNGGLLPNGIIKVGQAFMVQKKTVGSAPLEFKNSYGVGHDLRKAGTGSIFFQKKANDKNRFWISLIGPAQMVNSQLIGYMAGATNDYEQDFDTEAFDDYSDLFYSVLEDKKLVIQGKSDLFTREDRVPLGANFYQNGAYTIALDNAEGIFNEGQSVYLKDKQTGVTANLSEGSYTFQALKGLSSGRFEIVYKPEIVLVTDHKTKNGVEVYRDQDDFIVKAQHNKITAIQVFDPSGKLVYSSTPNSLQTIIPVQKLLNTVYVVKINQGGTITTRKIMK